MDWDLPPESKKQPLFLYNDLQHLLRLRAQEFVLGKEEHPHAVFPLAADGNALFPGNLLKKGMGNLQHDSHAVAHLSGGVLARAVFQLFYNL